MTDGNLVVQQLFGIGRDEFVDQYYGKQFIHFASDETLALTHSLPSLTDFASLISLAAINSTNVQLTAFGKPIRTPLLPNGMLDLQAIWTQFYDGTSIVLNNLHRVDRYTKKICNALFTTLGHKLGANAYLTPPGSAAFSTHYDTHDVVVVQVAGEKQWSLFERPPEVPPSYHERLKLTEAILEANPLADIVMKAGSVMYIPRGTPHRAQTEAGTSLHVTFGLDPIDLATVAKVAVDMLRNEDQLFREHLSPDLFLNPDFAPSDEVLSKLSETLSNSAFMAKVMQVVRKHAIQEELLPVIPNFISPGTKQPLLRWRSGVYLEVRELSDTSLLLTNGVKATELVGEEMQIFRSLHAATRAGAECPEGVSELAYAQVVKRLSALGLVEPVDV